MKSDGVSRRKVESRKKTLEEVIKARGAALKEQKKKKEKEQKEKRKKFKKLIKKNRKKMVL